MIPDIPGRELGISSNEAFDLKALPHSILIEGGGYVGVEFATIFAGLGVHTTIVYRGTCVLRGFDEDLRRGLDAGLHARGISTIYETTVRALRRQGSDIVASFSDGVEAPFGAVMFATGRSPNVAGFGLEQVGVKLRPDGAIAVDPYSQTSVPSIYAVGDVTGRTALTPVAIRDGAAVAETLFNNNPVAVDHSMIGTAVFAEPELATIGLTEAEALTHGDIDVYATHFRPMMNTLSDKADRMMLKELIPWRRPARCWASISSGPCCRNGAAGGHSARHGGDQGRFRPGDGDASDRRRGTGDLQGADVPLSRRRQALTTWRLAAMSRPC